MHLIPISQCYRLFQHGYSLITIGKDKKPNFPWKEQQTTPLHPAEFKQRYEFKAAQGSNREATEGVGLVCGYGGLEVVDVDLKVFTSLPEQDAFWRDLLSFLQDNIDDFDRKFVIYKTRNQGYHILYRCSEPAGNTKLAKLAGHQEAVIETRGRGGYVFVYDNQISRLGYNDVQQISANDREILWRICRTFNHVEPQPESEQITREAAQYVSEEVTPWADFNQRNTWSDVVGDEFKIVRNTSAMYIIKRDGGDSPHSGYVYKNSGGLYLFTTATRYPHERLLFPFHLYAYRHHNGDMRAAARDLYSSGYGTRKAGPAPVKHEPLPREQFNPDDAVFPIDIFPAGIQQYMKENKEYLNLSYDYMGAAMVWLTSVIVGSSIRIEVATGWEEPGVLWIAAVGKPGWGKTPSIKVMLRPLQEQNNREIKQYIDRRKAYDEYESLKEKDKANHEIVPKPSKTQFIVNDITMEALIDLHQESRVSVGVFKDELNGWFKDMNRYRAGSDLETWLSAWNGEAIHLNRLTRPSSSVPLPHIPVLGGIQPGVLDVMFSEQNKDNGFIDRILLCYPDLKVEYFNEAHVSQEIIDWYRQTVTAFFQFVRHKLTAYAEDGDVLPYTARMTKEARKRWAVIFNEITDLQNSDDENEYTKSLLAKQKSYIPRFALLLNALDAFCQGKDGTAFLQVGPEILDNAYRLFRYFIAMSKKVRSDSVEVAGMKTMVKKAGSPKEAFMEMYRLDPDLNKTKAAEILGVSRRVVYKWINETNEE